MAHVGFRYTIQWFTPYGEPPDGKPRIKAEMFETVEQRNIRTSNGEPPVPEWFSLLHKPRDQYSLYIQAIKTPMKQLSKETLAIIRKKRTLRRLQNKYPMLVDELFKEELKNNPTYFAGETRLDLEESRQAVLDIENENYMRFLAATGGSKQTI